MPDPTDPDSLEARVRRRLAVIELAEALGSVAEACRRLGMDRTSFYVWKRRYDAEGLGGLRDRRPVPRNHPATTPPEVVDRLLDLSLRHPQWGCVRVAQELSRLGHPLSSPTCQALMQRHGIGTRRERLALLERLVLAGKREAGPALIAQLERANPGFEARRAAADRERLQ